MTFNNIRFPLLRRMPLVLLLLARLMAVSFVAMSVCTPALADWIKPLVSTRAKVDSIERVLVIRDVDTGQSFGKRMIDLGNIDGRLGNELLVTRWQGGHDTNRCFIYSGGLNATGTPIRSYPYIGSDFNYLGDLNGDGFVDFGQWHLPLQPQINFDIFFGGPQFDNIPEVIIPNHFTFSYQAIDVDGDGILELPVVRDVNGRPAVYIDLYKTGPNFDTMPDYVISDTNANFGDPLCTGDFNGDGLGDIVVSSRVGVGGYSTASVYVYFGVKPYDTSVDLIIQGTSQFFGQMLCNIGDFNEDGYDDLAIFGSDTARDGIYLGSASFDGTRDIVVNQMRGSSGYFQPYSVERAGDVNHDGYPDFIMGYVNSVASRYEAHLYLGGKDVSAFMPADIWIEDYMVAGWQYQFGEAVAGIGDFTGDGIDDFAVRSRTGNYPDTWYGEVNIFAGWDGHATDAVLDDDEQIPGTFVLQQNYPNPFNGSTQIEFSLATGAPVSLVVFNSMGGRVRTLVDRFLSAGSHRSRWDGTDSAGKAVASGVYLYRLTVGEQSWSRKMQLIK